MSEQVDHAALACALGGGAPDPAEESGLTKAQRKRLQKKRAVERKKEVRLSGPAKGCSTAPFN
jgi:hypothetical protein